MSYNSLRRRALRSVPAIIGVAVLSAATVVSGAQAVPKATSSGGSAAPCTPPPPPGPGQPPPQTPTATTVGVISDVYQCILTNYYAGSTLDERMMLISAFAGLVNELERRGIDQSFATMPELTGDRAHDWAAFSAVLERVFSHVSNPKVRQAVAEATVQAMIAALHDNHVRWTHPDSPPLPGGPTTQFGLGFQTNPAAPLAEIAPAEAVGPLYVSSVIGGSPAASAGVKAGDVIEAVDGSAPFADGLVSQGVINLLNRSYPDATPVKLTLHRPSTGRTWTVAVTPALYTPTTAVQPVTSKLLPGDIAYVGIAFFAPGVADQALKDLAGLAKQHALKGVVLDLRGNGGGSPAEVSRLLGAFEHGTPYAYDCDSAGHCDPVLPDATTPLLHLPLVELTDRNCASGCDAFSGAVKDLHLGTIIGTRTSGIVSGPASGWLFSDGSFLMMPSRHELCAHHETINGIGVTPDYFLPLTAEDVSFGRDPDVAKALNVLDRF